MFAVAAERERRVAAEPDGPTSFDSHLGILDEPAVTLQDVRYLPQTTLNLTLLPFEAFDTNGRLRLESRVDRDSQRTS